MFRTHIQGQKEQLLHFTKLESTYRVLGLKPGIYGQAAAAKSLVFKAIVQRNTMQKKQNLEKIICSDELSHTLLCKTESSPD